ncbi:MAG TPA: DUF3987 domain-containing protein [Streptosporangiaceae bacterium]|jgi:hypothetical protein|nr:DUF3987 domain-containing protein [Streptosporangiaceae bacterium]
MTTAPPPRLPETALHGLPGEAVHLIDPHTEASRAAVLFTFLAATGIYLKPQAHMFAGDAIHPARLWPLIVGPTANGMKGTSWNAISRVLETADITFATTNIVSGLSTPEGLIELVRDGNGLDPEADGFDEGVHDKRRIIIEAEFASVLTRARKEGNALAPIIRDVWDGKRLQTLTRKVNALTATGHHIGVIGQITPTELVAKLTAADMAGGTINRFLPVYSVRSKRLPDGGGIPDDVLAYLAASLKDVKQRTRNVGRITRTPAARKLWHHYYDELTPENLPEGPVAWICARAVPQVIRLSVIYTLLDGRDEVDEQHLIAALAAWNYVRATIDYVFGGSGGNPDLGRLMEYVDGHGLKGVSRNRIAKDLFRNHKSRTDLDRLLDLLTGMEEYESAELPTGGRPATIFRRKPAPTDANPWTAG